MTNISDNIIKYIASFDSAGTNGNKVDTLLEYNKLGEYLNGGYIKDNVQYSELSKKDKNILTALYNNLKDNFAKFISNEQENIKINAENASEYAHMVRDLEKQEDETSKLTFEKLQKALYKFAQDNEYDLEDSKYNELDYNFIMEQVKDIIKTKEEREALAKKTLKNVNEPYNNSKLQASIKEYIQKNNVKPLENHDSEVNLGNGEFDKTATQNTNVCWALASINSLLTTEKGKKLLESNSYYDKETGVFAIHLQEAEDNGFHDGIYMITPEDIEAESANLAEGEGDATAYLIAIKRYFEEVNQNPELADKMESDKHTTRNLDNGNYGFRFFEILTGGQFSKYNYQDINRNLQPGIGTGVPDACGNFEYICDIMNNKNGAVTIAVGDHSISVVGVRDGNLLIQESNNSEFFAEEYSDKQRNHVIFNRVEDINGAPAYLLSKDDYKHYIQAVSFLKW